MPAGNPTPVPSGGECGGCDRGHPESLTALAGAFATLEAGRSTALLPPATVDVRWSEPPDSTSVWVGVTSSGSTGTPKLVWRRWLDLKAAARVSDAVSGWVWASPFDPWSFAGIQVAVQAWRAGGRTVSLRGDWPGVWRALAAEAVDAISATPTFFDLLLQNEPAGAAGWQPRQVTLGGEPLRPALGTLVAARWPSTRFVTIYASAEFGVLLKTRRVDGWYEVAALESRWPQWRVTDGVLELGNSGGWLSTGDRVEVNGDLMRVLGRADHVANVAGTKVNLPEVGMIAEEVAGVARAVAVAQPSPVTGQVVCLRYALEPGADAGAVRARLQAEFQRRLPKAAWPRNWVVDELAPVQNAKRTLR